MPQPRFRRHPVHELFVPRIIPITYSLLLSSDNEAVLKQLKNYTTRAEAGKIHGLCLITANIDQTFDFEAVGSYERFPTEAIGPLEVLKLKLTRKALDEL